MRAVRASQSPLYRVFPQRALCRLARSAAFRDEPQPPPRGIHGIIVFRGNVVARLLSHTKVWKVALSMSRLHTVYGYCAPELVIAIAPIIREFMPGSAGFAQPHPRVEVLQPSCGCLPTLLSDLLPLFLPPRRRQLLAAVAFRRLRWAGKRGWGQPPPLLDAPLHRLLRDAAVAENWRARSVCLGSSVEGRGCAHGPRGGAHLGRCAASFGGLDERLVHRWCHRTPQLRSVLRRRRAVALDVGEVGDERSLPFWRSSSGWEEKASRMAPPPQLAVVRGVGVGGAALSSTTRRSSWCAPPRACAPGPSRSRASSPHRAHRLARNASGAAAGRAPPHCCARARKLLGAREGRGARGGGGRRVRADARPARHSARAPPAAAGRGALRRPRRRRRRARMAAAARARPQGRRRAPGTTCSAAILGRRLLRDGGRRWSGGAAHERRHHRHRVLRAVAAPAREAAHCGGCIASRRRRAAGRQPVGRLAVAGGAAPTRRGEDALDRHERCRQKHFCLAANDGVLLLRAHLEADAARALLWRRSVAGGGARGARAAVPRLVSFRVRRRSRASPGGPQDKLLEARARVHVEALHGTPHRPLESPLRSARRAAARAAMCRDRTA